jgi:hypothetical protein
MTMAAPITETFDGIPLSGDGDPDDTRSFGDSPRIVNGWTINLLDADGNNAPGDGGTPSYLDVTGNAGDTVLVGPGDNALSVNGSFGIVKEAQFSATGGEEFWLQSFHLENAGMGASVRVLGYRNGVQIASQDFTVTVGADTLVTLNQGADQDWQNIDEFRIVQQDGNADILFYIDDITVSGAVLPNVAPIIGNLGGDSVFFIEDGGAVLLDAGGDATVVDSDSPDFDGGSIVVKITADGTPGEDVLSVQNEGSGAGQVGVSGSSVLYGGVVLGAISGGTGANDLVISLNGQATPDAVQAILRKLIYANTNTLDPSTLLREVQISVNDGDGGSTTQTVTMNVVSVNDAPVLGASGGTTAFTEGDPSVVVDSGLALSDDSATLSSATVSITGNFQSGQDELLFVNTPKITGIYNTATGVLSLDGIATVAELQAALRSVAYRNNSDLPDTTSRTIGFVINDGGLDSNVATKTVSVAGVNDAPVVTMPLSINVTEDVLTALTGISFADVDAGVGAVTATFSVGSGTLTGTDRPGVTVTGSGTGTLTLLGSIADINGFIADSELQFQTALNSTSDVTLVVDIDDNGNTGSGGNEFYAQALILAVTAVNDAPVVSVPSSISVTEDVASSVTGISFSDADAGGSSVTATLSVASGTLAATSAAGVTVGGTSSALTLTGTIANINAFIGASNVTFTTASNVTSDVTLTAGINDGGNSGSGGAQTDSDTVTLQVAAVNDAPVVTPPLSINVNEDVVTALTGISFADVDAGSGTVTATFSVGSGTLTGTTGSGVTVTGSGSGTLTLSGSIADINSFIAASQLSFQTALNSTSNVVLTVGIDDNGNTGSGGTLTDTDTVSLVVTAVNDAPVNAVPAAQAVDQDAALIFSSGNGNLISISDVDAGGGTTRVTLTASNGLITLSGTTGLSFIVGSGAYDGIMTFEGTIANINAALNGTIFSPTPGYNGAASLQITTSDLGLTGSGGTQTDTDTIAITVSSLEPEITSVNVTNPDGAYKAGDAITVTVSFDQAVTVNTTGGSPTLPLETGATDRLATYVSGSGSGTLTFSYTVQADDLSADLDYQSTGALTLNGATIRSATNVDALLTLPATEGVNSISGQHDIVVDGVAPVVASVSVPANGTYTAGQNLDFVVGLSEAVSVSGRPRLAITLDTGGTVYANYIGGSGTHALVFRLTVSAGQQDLTGIQIGASIDLNGGTLRDAAGNDAVLTLNSGSTAGVLVDGVAPTVDSVSVPADGTYVAGQNLDFTVNLSEAVIVDTTGGTPRLAITIGSGTVYANYISGSGTDALLFRLTVSAGQQDLDGIQIGGSIDPNGGTLRDAAGNSAVMTLNSVESTAGVLVNTATLDIIGTLEIDEAAANGSSAGTLTAAGGSSYTFSLISGAGDDDNANFSIDSAGNVSVVNGLLLDYEQKNTFSIRVRVESDGLTVEKVLTGSVGDINPENITGDGDPNVFVGGGLDDRLSGAGGNDTLSGGDGNDLLNGGTGNDHMIGGAGNDIFVVDSAGDSTIEAAAGGTDTVRAFVNWTLADNVERLELQGSGNLSGAGNSLNNTLVGTSGDNLLNGGAGNDYMVGGAGNDIFVVDASGDRVIEAANGGIDTVRSYIDWSLADNVERLELQGSGDLNGTGNALNNTLVGNAGNNVLNGGAGNDYMVGGAGNDIFVVNASGDRVIEAANGGIDTVRSYIDWMFAENVDRLELIGPARNSTGNALNNTLVGNAGANVFDGGDGDDYLTAGASNDTLYGGGGSDRLVGGAGADILFGGAGNDFFRYEAVTDSLVGPGNRDTHFLVRPASFATRTTAAT